MLFEKDGRGLQFSLINLGDTEYNEISQLIQDHGGVISNLRDPPAITFSKDVNEKEEHPVFHVNYIRECVKQDKLLHLIDFILGSKGYYGCLMSIFTNGTNV